MARRKSSPSIRKLLGIKKPRTLKQVLGISRAQSKLSRQIGIPLSASGRRKKFGKYGLVYLLNLLFKITKK